MQRIIIAGRVVTPQFGMHGPLPQLTTGLPVDYGYDLTSIQQLAQVC